MEEEPNEHELEERLYSMLHYVDETQANVNTANQNDTLKIVENAPRSTFRRYWRTSGDQPSQFQKVNTPKENGSALSNKHVTTTKVNNLNQKPKAEKCHALEVESTVDFSIFQSPPQIIKKTIEILDSEINPSVLLESSDEDEIIEVALPPKPTITIESSDEDEVCVVSKPDSGSKDECKQQPAVEHAGLAAAEREVTASPVPSVVSSVSDEFIRGDCIALNISSKNHDNHNFDFSLHGADLLGQVTPSKKKKKKKSKEATTSTPVNAANVKPTCPTPETCFATPKSKAKNKKQKKSYVVSEKSVPSADVYDSDSNQSVIEPIKNHLPNTDVYESDSSQSDDRNKTKAAESENILESSVSSISLDVSEIEMSNNSKKDNSNILNNSDCSFVDLTDSDNYITLDTRDITENIVMGNVTGFQESEDYGDEPMNVNNSAPILGSTKVPQILFENLDFDNLKGKDKVCRGRRYSLTTLRAEMEKFYNESWGGEDFNHREIQKYMSRDKSLWVIDPKDRMPALSKRKTTCNYCNRSGHRDDSCRMKPPVCYMCGSTGHYEPRCPSKICVNCGSPNHMYSTMCRNCAWWARLTCAECGQPGHPPTHCPDLWRRYHNTIDNNAQLAENRQTKKNHQLYCSGCTRRGHLVHTCRLSLPFSGLPINSPYVAIYHPVHLPDRNLPNRNLPNRNLPNRNPPNRNLPNRNLPNRNLPNRNLPSHKPDVTVSSVTPSLPSAMPRSDRNKRQSKSPTVHENHLNKKKNMTITDIVEMNEKNKGDDATRSRKNSVGKTPTEDNAKTKNPGADSVKSHPATVEPAPNFIPLSSANRDKRGHIIQDNEVSDTTDVVTSARIYVPNEVTERLLKSEEGAKWVKEITEKLNVVLETSEVNSFLSIKGKLADQEAFQRELREWSRQKPSKENSRSEVLNESGDQSGPETTSLCDNIPKKRCNLLRKLSSALDSLKSVIGDPEAIYQELGYLQNRHEQLLKQKVISPKQLSNNRDNINTMLKKLNMVLLGQVGLADGSKHLSELYAIHERLTNARQKFISPDLRKEIGQHYHSIFTSIPRNDYADLLKKYRNTKQVRKSFKRNIRSFRSKKKTKIQKKPVGVVAPVQKAPPPPQVQKAPNQAPQNQAQSGEPFMKFPPLPKSKPIAVGKLTFFHNRIVNSRPASGALKKERMDLVRKLHSHISSLNKKEQISSKQAKKMKKIQDQAQKFLSNM